MSSLMSESDFQTSPQAPSTSKAPQESPEDPRLTKLREFALTELFNFYVRRNVQERPSDFDDMQDGLKRLNLKGYVAFVKDMQFPIDMARLNQVWRKSSSNNQTFSYDDFRQSLPRLHQASTQYRVEYLKRKANQTKL